MLKVEDSVRQGEGQIANRGDDRDVAAEAQPCYQYQQSGSEEPGTGVGNEMLVKGW
jgi:hypothetical protein